MCGGLYGWTTSRRVLSFIWEDWMEAGIPDVLLHSNASFDAYSSISCHIFVLKGAFSGPCSWIINADRMTSGNVSLVFERRIWEMR